MLKIAHSRPISGVTAAGASMGPQQIPKKPGMRPRAKSGACNLVLPRWMLELLGLLALSAFIQLAGPLMWSPSVVEVLVSGFSSVPLVGAMLVLMFVALGVWCIASTFDLDGALLPVIKWIFTTARTYTLSIAAIVLVGVLRGAFQSEFLGNLVLAAVIGVGCGAMLRVLDQRKRQIAQSGSDSVSVLIAVFANCMLTILAVASFWGFINFQQIVALLK